jgi:hypothetical protein
VSNRCCHQGKRVLSALPPPCPLPRNPVNSSSWALSVHPVDSTARRHRPLHRSRAIQTARMFPVCVSIKEKETMRSTPVDPQFNLFSALSTRLNCSNHRRWKFDLKKRRSSIGFVCFYDLFRVCKTRIVPEHPKVLSAHPDMIL